MAILVYNGRDFVPACLSSAAGLRVGPRQVDVLVLDDCSPEPGWSDELRGTCESLGVEYYRSPRNLGIPRNMNLALLRAVAGGYDHVLIVNSDVVLPLNAVSAMVGVAENNPAVGSVTAWSNNVSVFSIPNDDDTGLLARQDMVDWISADLEREFGTFAFDVPTGVGFCLLIPVPVIERVGLFDPVYGRGYCEEVDWCLRSRERGYRAVLAPSTFVYHVGSGSTVEAGMLARRATTVNEHEDIVDLRYPRYRDDIREFFETGALPPLVARAVRSIILHAAARFGYEIDATWLPTTDTEERVRFVVDPDGRSAVVSARFCGFRFDVDVPDGNVPSAVWRMTGYAPVQITVFDRGTSVDQLVAAWGEEVPFVDRYGYPQRV